MDGVLRVAPPADPHEEVDVTEPFTDPPAASADVAEQQQDVWENDEPENIVLPDEERPVPIDDPEE